MASRIVLLDITVLFCIGVPWLAIPAYLEALQVPFSEVATASLSLMVVVLICAFSWSFVIRGRLVSKTEPPDEFGEARVAFFAFMAYFWSLVDDAPVGFDSISTWPEVTSGFQHTLTEVILHVLTAAFMFLAMRGAVGRIGIAPVRKELQVSILAIAAFWASYFQNTPWGIVQVVARNAWYPLDFAEHAVSLALLYFAIRTARSPLGLTGVEPLGRRWSKKPGRLAAPESLGPLEG